LRERDHLLSGFPLLAKYVNGLGFTHCQALGSKLIDVSVKELTGRAPHWTLSGSEEKPERSKLAKAPNERFDFRRQKVIVIDDEPRIGGPIRQILRQQSCWHGDTFASPTGMKPLTKATPDVGSNCLGGVEER
jgi:hypothetical protein